MNDPIDALRRLMPSPRVLWRWAGEGEGEWRVYDPLDPALWDPSERDRVEITLLPPEVGG